MAQPAFAAVGFSITEHQAVQIGDRAFKRAYMEKPLYPSHHPALSTQNFIYISRLQITKLFSNVLHNIGTCQERLS
jgi:hypothetical protein